MNKEQLVGLGLTDEQATKVLDAFKGYIPASRFNEVNEAKKTAEAMVADRDAQLAELKKSVGNNEELKKQIETLQANNEKAQAQHKADLQRLKIDGAIETALASNGALSVKAAKALLDMGKITLEGDEVKGLKEQIEGVVKEHGYLFKTNTPKGMHAGEGKKDQKPKSVDEMNYSELVAYMAEGGKLD